jgi:hypothetical protein
MCIFIIKNNYNSPFKYYKTFKNITLHTRIGIDNCQYQPGNEESSSEFARVSLKVVSSENKGGSKIAPIVGYWPRTVALGIILNF